MTFQAYLDTIFEKTGKTPAEFRALAEEKGLLAADVTVTAVVQWLGDEFDLGRGHAMALINTFGKQEGAGLGRDEKIDKQFSGAKARWRASYDDLLAAASSFGPVSVLPTNTYVSFVRGGKKFAIVAATVDRLDVGLKVKGADAEGRFEAAGSWNEMVTHRVRVTDPAQVDDELRQWLRRAYDGA